MSREGIIWTPWKVTASLMPSRSKKKCECGAQRDCDPVTCSECPGGDRCCQAPYSDSSTESQEPDLARRIRKLI